MPLNYDAGTKILAVENIADQTGTGAPNFPNGLKSGGTTLPSSLKYQIKRLTSNITSTNVNVTALSFNNLTIGRTYRVSGKLDTYNLATGTCSSTIRFRDNISGTGTPYFGGVVQFENPAGNGRTIALPVSFIFVAATTIFTTDFNSGNSGLVGDPSYHNTYLILEELPLHITTADWT